MTEHDVMRIHCCTFMWVTLNYQFKGRGFDNCNHRGCFMVVWRVCNISRRSTDGSLLTIHEATSVITLSKYFVITD